MGAFDDNDDLFERLLQGEDVGDPRLSRLITEATRPATASELVGIEPALEAFRRSIRPTPRVRRVRYLRGVPAAAAAVAASVLVVGGGLGIALTHALSTPATPTTTKVTPTNAAAAKGRQVTQPGSATQSGTGQERSGSHPPTSIHANGPIPGIPRGSSDNSLATLYGICTAWEADQHAPATSLHALEQSTEYQRLVTVATARGETVAALCSALTGTPTKGVAHPNSTNSAGALPSRIPSALPTTPGRPSQVP